MPQRQQIFTTNGIYHIYNRGHNKQTIFFHEKDYKRYIKRLTEYLKKHSITLLAYCLMPNHIHLLLEQETEEPVGKFVHRLHTAYTMYFNKKYERVGAVFQGRFKAKKIETDEYLLHVSRYIHLNPIELFHSQGPALRSKLIKFPWSSYRDYVQAPSTPLSQPLPILAYFNTEKPKIKNADQLKKKYKLFVENSISQLSEDNLINISNGIF